MRRRHHAPPRARMLRSPSQGAARRCRSPSHQFAFSAKRRIVKADAAPVPGALSPTATATYFPAVTATLLTSIAAVFVPVGVTRKRYVPAATFSGAPTAPNATLVSTGVAVAMSAVGDVA